MPKKSPIQFAWDYLELCSYKWAFLRRNPLYRRDFKNFTRRHGDTLSVRDPVVQFYDPENVAPGPDMDLCRKYGVGYLHDPAHKDGLIKDRPASGTLTEAFFGPRVVFLNPFYDNLAGSKVYLSDNAGRKTIVPPGWQSFVFDMRAALPLLLAEAEFLFQAKLPARAKSAPSKAKRFRRKDKLVDFAIQADPDSPYTDVHGEPIEEPYYIVLSVNFNPPATLPAIMTQLEKLLQQVTRMFTKTDAPLYRRELRLRFKDYERYLKVWDLRRPRDKKGHRKSFLQIAKALKPSLQRDKRFKQNVRAWKKNKESLGEAPDKAARDPAARYVMELYNQAKKLIFGGYRELDYDSSFPTNHCLPIEKWRQFQSDLERFFANSSH